MRKINVVVFFFYFRHFNSSHMLTIVNFISILFFNPQYIIDLYHYYLLLTLGAPS